MPEMPWRKHKCHICGKPAIIYDIDPYLNEYYPDVENPEEWWCEEHYLESLMDI